MNTLKLKSQCTKNSNVYSYNEYDNYSEDIIKFVDFIYKIIDYSDSFYYLGQITPNKIKSKINNNIIDIELTHTYNNEDTVNFYKNINIFDISTVKNKNYLKKNLKFNVSDPDDREPIIINTNCKNVANDPNNMDYDTTIVFVKNNRVLFNFYLYDGYLYDYTKPDIDINCKTK